MLKASGKDTKLGERILQTLNRHGFLTVSPFHRQGAPADEIASFMMFTQDIIEARNAFAAATQTVLPIKDRTIVLDGSLLDEFISARDATYKALKDVSELEQKGEKISEEIARNTIDSMDEFLAVTMMSARSAPQMA